MGAIKESQTKNEATIKSLQEKLDKATEDLLEKEGEITEKEQAWEAEKQKISDKSSKLESKYSDLKSEFETLTKQNDHLKTEVSSKSKSQILCIVTGKQIGRAHV